MTFQWIRKDGEIRGFALMLGEGRVIAASVPDRELWRVCDCCTVSEAIVFCRTHSKYLCGICLAQLPSVHRGCEFISVAVARDLVQRAEKYAEVEL
jgi:hypothetical protein